MATDGWTRLADGMLAAGAQLADLKPDERDDARRALLRALNNRLSRIEKDSGPAELTPFNGWREKFFMDNPNYRYWIADLHGDGSYRIIGNIGDSVYQSITVYSGATVADAKAVARIDTDSIDIGADGDFSVELPPLPPDASSVWVRYVHGGVNPANPGWCAIDAHENAFPATEPDQLDRDLSMLGKFVAQLPAVFDFATTAERESPNTVRHWSAMSGGAAFTEPGVHYLRGGWQLEPGQALLIDGAVPDCRNWNIVLYNRFLNSLDYRRQIVSHTGDTATVRGGGYRFALSSSDPRIDGYDWLDTQGRGCGVFVLRFLQPAAEPVLPSVRVIR